MISDKRNAGGYCTPKECLRSRRYVAFISLSDSTALSHEQRGVALNEDGTLKEAHEIPWFNDPDDEVSIF